MLNLALTVSVITLIVAVGLCLVRLVRGPSLPDRILGLDTVGAVLMGLIVVVSIRFDLTAYYDIVLVLATLLFVGTVVAAKFLGAGTPVERSDS